MKLQRITSKLGTDLRGKIDGHKIYYHGSPVRSLSYLRQGSYVTPSPDLARLMGRYYKNSGKTWQDSDLEEPYVFGSKIRWREGKEPDGEPVVYSVKLRPEDLDLLDNPYEHITKVRTPVFLAYNDDIAKSSDILDVLDWHNQQQAGQ